ncbi:MAG: hypothetical protein IIZ14_03495 [Solobacterium sp.]|nr:hypothetical protein [Solobacterium sp.]
MKKIISILMCAVLMTGCAGKSSDNAKTDETIRVTDGVIQYSDDSGTWYNLITIEELMALKEMANGMDTQPVEPTEEWIVEPAEDGGQSQTAVDPNHQHVYNTAIASGAPTCTAEGYATYRCSCGQTITRKIPPLGHDMQLIWAADPTCYDTGYRTYRCARCGADEHTEFIPKLTDGCPAETVEEPSAEPTDEPAPSESTDAEAQN